MPNITIRNVPPEIHEGLAARAEREGQSLQQYLLGVLEEAATLLDTNEWLDRIERRMAASGPRPATAPRVDTAELIRQEHEERDARIVRR